MARRLGIALTGLFAASIASAGHPPASPAIWEELAPPARSEHVAAFDAHHRRLVIFGGQVEGALRADLWVLTLGPHSRWERIEPRGEWPKARIGAASVYDATRDRLLMFGGVDTSGAPLGDLWELTLRGRPSWRRIAIRGSAPEPRCRATLTLDPHGDAAILYGGSTTTSPYFGKLGDAWRLNLHRPAWSALAFDGGSPTARSGHSAVDCPELGGVLMFGGVGLVSPFPGYWEDRENSEVWLMETGAHPRWSELTPSTPDHPCISQGHVAVWDAPEHRMLVCEGGSSGYGTCNSGHTELWAFEVRNRSWSTLPTDLAPQRSRFYPASCYDPVERRLYLQGGMSSLAGGCWADTWTLSLRESATWDRILPTTNDPPPPPGLEQHSMVYDPVGDRALYDAESAIWALDLEGGRWSPIEAVGEAPPPHHRSTLVMDPLRNRVLLFGGQSRTPPSFPALADVWSLDLAPPARWSRLSPSGDGPAPLFETGVYDPVRDRLLVFSGQAFGPDHGSGLFELPLGDDHSLRWNPLATTAPEDTRLDYLFDQVFAYDSRADQLLFFGGGIRNPDDIWSTNGFWNLPLAPPLEWRILSPPEVWYPGSTISGVSPRFNAAGVYDPDANRLLVFGGALQSLFGGPLPDDAVAFALDSKQWTTLERIDDGLPGWAVPAAVYDLRRHRTLVLQGDAVWALASRPRCERDPIRRLATRDAMDAVAGSTLELRGAWPNPSVAGVEIAFALPDNSESSLELVDVAGRRVWSEDVGGLGVGFHRVRIARAQSLAPGVYLLSLHHGTGTHTTKLVRLAR